MSKLVFFTFSHQAKSIKKASQKTEVFTVEAVAEHGKNKEEEIKPAPPLEGEADSDLQEKSTGLSELPSDSPSLDTDQYSWVNWGVIDLDSSTEGSVEQEKKTSTQDISDVEIPSQTLDKKSLGSLGKWTWDIHSIILDLSPANFTDTVAIKLMKNVSWDYESNLYT